MDGSGRKEVEIVEIDIPFLSLMALSMKFALAALPAMLLLVAAAVGAWNVTYWLISK